MSGPGPHAGVRTAGPGHIEQRLQAAAARHQRGQPDDIAAARACYDEIIASDPRQHVAWNLRGLARFQLGDPAAARTDLAHAARLAPRIAKYHYDLGVVVQTGGEPAAAERHYESAVALDPGLVVAWENLGVARFDRGRRPQASAAFEQALALRPDSLLALANLATLRRWDGAHAEALALLERGLALDPLNADFRMKRAEALLSAGNYAYGWPEYDWRFLHGDEWGARPAAFVPLRRWGGEPLAGRQLLVHAEQGIGDEVMFGGFLDALEPTRARVAVLCDPRLAPALQRSWPGVQVVPSQPGEWGAAGETVAADCRLPIGDLPRLAPELVPRPGWLRADPVLRARWRERLEQLGPGPRVGIAWRGGATARTRAARSVPLAEFAALCAAGAARFVSLQYGEVTADLAAAPRRLRERLTVFADLDPLRDLEGLFALMSELDLVITVDNSTVHFAGALGVPAWLLLPALADWRWPTAGTGSRWYASVRLHRPASGGSRGWREPLQRLAGELAGLPSRPPAGPALAPLPPPPLLPATPAGTRALLLNDTSRWYHWGCACTSLALRDGLTARGRRVQGVPIDALGQLQPLPTSRDALADEHLFAAFRAANAGLCRALETADEVWINGEGSLHGASPLAVGLLYLAWLAATRFGKPVRIVNHSCYPGTGPVQAYYQAVYARLAGVAVREPVSAALLRQQGLAVTETFDCLPLFATAVADDIRREPGTDVLIAGSVAHDAGMVAACAALATTLRQRGLRPRLLVGAPANLAADDRSFGRALHAATAGGVEILLARSELEWLSAIASARLLVSGRFHYSIAAAWLGTPFLALDSNTPKMAGLMQVLGLAGPPERGTGNLAALLEQRAEQLLAAGDAGLLAAGKRAELLAAARRNFD